MRDDYVCAAQAQRRSNKTALPAAGLCGNKSTIRVWIGVDGFFPCHAAQLIVSDAFGGAAHSRSADSSDIS